MVFTDAKTVIIDEKEVKSIVLQDGGILYKKNKASIIFSFTGTNAPTLLGDDFGNNTIVFWGDGSKTKYVNGDMYDYENGDTYFYEGSNNFQHRYEDGKETHIIQIFNVKEIGDFAFLSKQGIDNVFISSDVTEIGYGAFMQCPLTKITLSEGLITIDSVCFSESNLTEIVIPSTVTNLRDNCFGIGTINKIGFLWDTAENIIAYSTNPYRQLSSDYKFYIPEGTTQLYVDKGYPLAKLVEKPTLVTLTSNKDVIISGETTILTASVLPKKENETIYLNKIINDENLTLELTSTNSGLNHEIKTKVTDENDNGLENIRIKLYKEE